VWLAFFAWGQALVNAIITALLLASRLAVIEAFPYTFELQVEWLSIAEERKECIIDGGELAKQSGSACFCRHKLPGGVAPPGGPKNLVTRRTS